MSGTDLITPTGRFPLGGSVNDLARRAGITPRALRDVYTGGPDFMVSCSFAHGRLLEPTLGAARPLSRLTSPPAILEFFLEGRHVATGDTAGNEPMPQT